MSDTDTPTAPDAAPIAAGAPEGAAAPAPAVETPPSAPAPDGETPAEGAGEGTVDPTPAPSASAAAEPPKKDWRDRRIAQLTAKLREAAPTKPATTEQPAAGDTLDEAEVNRRAIALAAQNDFNRRCNEVAEAGKASFGDFGERVAQLQHLFTPGNAAEEAAYGRLLEAALETDDPARVLYELGGDMDRAERLLALSPVKLGMEMAKMAAKQGEPVPSAAPKPITPVGGRGTAREEIDPRDPARADNLSGRTWIERRQKQVDARRAGGERNVW